MFLIFGFLEVSENIFTPKFSGFTVYYTSRVAVDGGGVSGGGCVLTY